jgi:hypothetical protein
MEEIRTKIDVNNKEVQIIKLPTSSSLSIGEGLG